MLDIVEVLAVASAGVAAGVGFARSVSRRGIDASARADDAQAVAADSRFERLLESLTVGIAIVDRREQIVTLNAAAATIFEIGSRSFAGRALIELVPSFELDRRVREALRGHPSRGRIALTTANGTRVLTVATLALDDPDGALVIASDETRLYELEQTRREFVSSVSHELRTPLSSINLMIETILDNDGDQEAIDLFLPRIKDEVDRMVLLVEDLLELARAESGRLRLRRERMDLAALARRILATFEPRAGRSGVRISCSGDPIELDGDPERLAQVLVNLIDNALRHTAADGRVDVVVSAHERAATLVVTDSGAGIPYNDLPHIFERFYVVDRSRARETAGSGLGLSIVKGIVEAHGGSISARSELGRGSTFTCSFPIVRPTAS